MTTLHEFGKRIKFPKFDFSSDVTIITDNGSIVYLELKGGNLAVSEKKPSGGKSYFYTTRVIINDRDSSDYNLQQFKKFLIALDAAMGKEIEEWEKMRKEFRRQFK